MKFLREPLVHFVAAGAVLFAAYAWFDRDQASSDSIEPVTVTEGDVQWLVETWRRQWMREPGPAEVRGMIADLVDEELMAREALEMGLEKDDTVVRRRLAQKLKFLVEDTSRLVEPSDAELRAYYAGHADRFQPGTTVSFTQVFFNPSDRVDAEADAEASLVALRNDAALPSTSGDRLLVEGDFTRPRPGASCGPLRTGLRRRRIRPRAGVVERSDRVGLRSASGSRFEQGDAGTASPSRL